MCNQKEHLHGPISRVEFFAAGFNQLMHAFSARLAVDRLARVDPLIAG